jgi:mRNA interferase RelE/StbE
VSERYRINFTKETRKGLEKLDRQAHRRVLLAIGKLEADPRPDGVKKLKGHDGKWRIRVGGWRVLYRIDDGRLVVIVLSAGHRSEARKEK